MEPDFKQLKLQYMRLFDTEEGKIVLKDIEEQAFLNSPIYYGDVNKALINEGARLLMLRIRDMALSPMPEDEAKEN